MLAFLRVRSWCGWWKEVQCGSNVQCGIAVIFSRIAGLAFA